MRHILPAYFLILLLFTSCATPSVREAREVLAECDSLRATGQLYADSARLADIVTSLNPIRFFYPDDYAKANYYYGRLLRNRDNYVAAMQCFIDAINTSSNDYEILGRAWSNCGSLCHLDEQYPLATDMYSKSSEQFLKTNDIQSYYYALNSMAYELIYCDQVDSSKMIIDKIRHECMISSIINKTYETEAELFLARGLYDSTIYCAIENVF